MFIGFAGIVICFMCFLNKGCTEIKETTKLEHFYNHYKNNLLPEYKGIKERHFVISKMNGILASRLVLDEITSGEMSKEIDEINEDKQYK